MAAFKAQLTAAAAPDARGALAGVIARAQAAQRQSGAGRLVYLQYADRAAAPAMAALQAALVARNFVAPGIEFANQRHFDPKTPNTVKYFHAEDAGIAHAIAWVADATLTKSCPGIAPIVVPKAPVPVADPAQATQLEVWIGTPCGAAAPAKPAPVKKPPKRPGG